MTEHRTSADGTAEWVTRPAVPSTQDRVTRSVKALLSARGRTGTDLAVHLGISTQAVHRRYAGVSPWRVDELDRVAAWLELPLEDLLRAGDHLAVVPAQRTAPA